MDQQREVERIYCALLKHDACDVEFSTFCQQMTVFGSIIYIFRQPHPNNYRQVCFQPRFMLIVQMLHIPITVTFVCQSFAENAAALQEFEAFKEHSHQVLTQERELNRRLRHLIY